ncbi:MAG: hypothetical protein WBP93_03295 [Pyrinomonadaceae bacterium]
MYTLEQFLYGRELHPELVSVLRNLSDIYGTNLLFLSRDAKWVNFCVRGYTDEVLFRDLQDHQDEIFGADFRDDPYFHVVRSYSGATRGIFLLYQSTTALYYEYLSGFWYY